MHDLLILGAGGHGRTLYETARLLGYKDIVFLDDNTSACQEINQLILEKFPNYSYILVRLVMSLLASETIKSESSSISNCSA
ncbi:hypothetical protein [Enterobacter sp. BIDMC 29]|uniref:PglD-related sugar-binding protein n=1 Tax=Enterobacter sp. BIDMC 29 TaxID=1329841 RepID=UPI00210242B4|nr:hypothetical protein [Enterobacter sp. BIDMC 29]